MLALRDSSAATESKEELFSLLLHSQQHYQYFALYCLTQELLAFHSKVLLATLVASDLAVTPQNSIYVAFYQYFP